MKKIRPTNAYIDQSRASQLLEKWAPVLNYKSDNVAPIEDDHLRLNTAMLLENQEQWCFESSYGGNGGSFGSGSSVGGVYAPPSTVTSNDGYATGDSRLPKILIPMIRRTFPELISNEIVGVQPMSGPVGLAFVTNTIPQDLVRVVQTVDKIQPVHPTQLLRTRMVLVTPLTNLGTNISILASQELPHQL